MKVSVVIVTFNGFEWIDKVIKSILSSTINVEIIIVDNNSSDETLAVVKQYQEINLIESKINLGFGKANNIAIKKAFESGADYVFLLNQDAWVTPDTIENLVKSIEKEPQYGIVSPMHLNGKGDAFDYKFSNYINPVKCKKLYSDIFLNSIMKSIYKTEFVNAAAWLISRKCLQIVGGFNPSFFHYGEDENYVHRVKFHEFNIGVCPNSIIYHDRENNAESDYSKDKKELYKRSLILNISNPQRAYSFKKEYINCYKVFLKSFIILQFGEIKECYWKIKILNDLGKEQILKNKLESLKEQPSFLN